MKTKLLKIFFFIFCVCVVVFLLLPFLETTSQPTPQAHKLPPQVGTSNPLTTIAKRLENLWNKGPERRRQTLSASAIPADRPAPARLASLAPAQRFEQYPLPAEVEDSSAPGKASQPLPPTQEPFDYADASLRTDNGEWVLIRQTTPQSGAPGMHEVNMHENPYDRYVKQERAQRFHPQETAPQIPDSKWARLVRPVKKWFGLDTPTAVAARPVSVTYEEKARPHLTASMPRQQKETKYVGTGSLHAPWPDISPLEWARMSDEERQREKDRRSVAQFAEMISGTRSAEDAAQIAADAKYPNPKDDTEQREKDQYKNGLIEKNKQAIRQGLLETMQKEANQAQSVDELSEIIGCHDATLPAPCTMPGQTPSPQANKLSESVITQEQETNANDFFNKTKYVLPKGLPITPVFGPTSRDTLQNLADFPDPNAQRTGELYQFLYDQQNCDRNDCYWIPSANQPSPQLQDAFQTVGWELKKDPLNISPTFKQPWVEYKMRQLPPEATDEQREQARKDAEKQFEENFPNFVPVIDQQLKPLGQLTSSADPTNLQTPSEDAVVIYVPNKKDTPAIANIVGHPYFLYGKETLSSVAPTNTSAIEAGRLITDSAVENVNNAKNIIADVVVPQYKEGVAGGIRQQVNEAIRQNNQTQDPGKNLMDAIKRLEKTNSPK